MEITYLNKLQMCMQSWCIACGPQDSIYVVANNVKVLIIPIENTFYAFLKGLLCKQKNQKPTTQSIL